MVVVVAGVVVEEPVAHVVVVITVVVGAQQQEQGQQQEEQEEQDHHHPGGTRHATTVGRMVTLLRIVPMTGWKVRPVNRSISPVHSTAGVSIVAVSGTYRPTVRNRLGTRHVTIVVGWAISQRIVPNQRQANNWIALLFYVMMGQK